MGDKIRRTEASPLNFRPAGLLSALFSVAPITLCLSFSLNRFHDPKNHPPIRAWRTRAFAARPTQRRSTGGIFQLARGHVADGNRPTRRSEFPRPPVPMADESEANTRNLSGGLRLVRFAHLRRSHRQQGAPRSVGRQV